MADSRCWSKEVLSNFIELYREMPCLWKIKSKEYLNKNFKNEGYDKLVEFCRPIFPSANRDFVYKKIQSLRGAFRKEFKKVADSIRSGKGAEEIYSPNLWYYDLMLFTVDQEKPNVSISNVEHEDDSSLEEENNTNTQEKEETETGDQEIQTLEPDRLSKCRTTATPNREKKRKRDTEFESFMRTCTTALQRPDHSKLNITEFEATGIKVGKQLERMDSHQAIYADSLIAAVLKRGLLGTLQPETTLCDNHCAVPTMTAMHYSTHFSSHDSSSNVITNKGQDVMGPELQRAETIRTYLTDFGGSGFGDPATQPE